FRNPVGVGGAVFWRRWDEAPSLEEVGMRGGYVQMAVTRGLDALAKGGRRLPGWQDTVVADDVTTAPTGHEHAARTVRQYARRARAPALRGRRRPFGHDALTPGARPRRRR